MLRVGGVFSYPVTVLAENASLSALEDLMLQGGVDTSLVRFIDFDGVGTAAHNRLNFTERGFGIRGAVGIPDRGHTAAQHGESPGFANGHVPECTSLPGNSPGPVQTETHW